MRLKLIRQHASSARMVVDVLGHRVAFSNGYADADFLTDQDLEDNAGKYPFNLFGKCGEGDGPTFKQTDLLTASGHDASLNQPGLDFVPFMDALKAGFSAKQLKAMAEGGLVRTTQDGNRTVYCLQDLKRSKP